MAHSGSVWPGQRQSGMSIAQWGATKAVYCDLAFDCDTETEDQCDTCGRPVCEDHSSTAFDKHGWVIRICHVCQPAAAPVRNIPVFRLAEWIPYPIRRAVFRLLERVA